MIRLRSPLDGPVWLPDYTRSIERELRAAQERLTALEVGLASYTVATVPDATANTARMIFVSDETGGAVPAFSDGTDWRRVTDRVVIS